MATHEASPSPRAHLSAWPCGPQLPSFLPPRLLALVALFTAGGTASGVGAEDLAGNRVDPTAVTQASAVPSPTPLVTELAEPAVPERRTLGRFFPNVGRSFVGVFSKETVAPLLFGGALSSFGSLFDDNVHNSVTHLSLGDLGDTLGGPAVSASLAIGLFVSGRFVKEGRFRAATYDLAVGTVLDAGYFQLVKVAVGRERPDRSNNQSFPSGHTSHAFMFATIAQKHYGWKLGAPLYAFAGFVGYSRLNKDVHWLSDVLAGATLGYISGITVVRQDHKPVPGRRTVMVAPILGPSHQRGLQLAVTFR